MPLLHSCVWPLGTYIQQTLVLLCAYNLTKARLYAFQQEECANVGAETDAHAGNTTLDSLKLTPKVKLIKWAPQNDVLGHPAVKAFLTQAGINSIHEAAYHAVPVVSVPLIADQVNNAVLVKSNTVSAHHPKASLETTQGLKSHLLAQVTIFAP